MRRPRAEDDGAPWTLLGTGGALLLAAALALAVRRRRPSADDRGAALRVPGDARLEVDVEDDARAPVAD